MGLSRSFLVFCILFATKVSHIICANEDTCPVPKNRGTFQKTGPNSKYLYDPLANYVSFSEVQSTCESMGLETAEIRSTSDLNYLVGFIRQKQLTGRNWALGLSDQKRPGFYQEASGAPIQYQNFWYGQGKGGSASCVELRMSPSEHFAMFNVPCSSNVFPLCQFKSTDPCNYMSPQSAQGNAQKDDLEIFGSTAIRNYYMSTKQKTWDEAMKFCVTHKKKLLDFINETDVEHLMEYTSAYIPRKGHEATGFWTSGKFDRGDIEWQSISLKLHQIHLRPGTLQWGPGEPSDHSRDKIENCVSFYISGVPVGPPQLAASNCFLPYYFICYEDLVEKEGPPILSVAVPKKKSMDGGGTGDEGKKADCKVGPPPKVNLYEPGLTTDEYIALVNYNLKSRLSSDRTQIKIKTQSEWRRPMIETLVAITRKLCPPEYVNRNFINLIRNYIYMYYEFIPFDNIIDEYSWDKYNNELQTCLKQLKPFDIVGDVLGVVGLIPNNATGAVPIHVPEETIDYLSEDLPDLIIDSFWFMFSTSFAACYPTVTSSRPVWASEYFYKFTQEFLRGFAPRWQFAGKVNYGLLFGDMELGPQIFNLRACTAAAYEYNGLFNMYLSRPLYLGSISDGTINVKTGEQLPFINYYP